MNRFFWLCTLCMVIVKFGQCAEFKEWVPYSTELFIPPVIDLREGGSIDLVMGQHGHHWGGGLDTTVQLYGYGIKGSAVTFPGPTILASKNVPVKITWHNNISGPHILDEYIEPSLMVPPASCYPKCGVPLITHIHGMEVPAASDGVPYEVVYYGQSRSDTYNNSQMSSTHVYHDHAMGLTRLNSWSGLLGTYLIEDPYSSIEQTLQTSCDIPLLLTDTMISTDASLLYASSECTIEETKWAPESYGSVNAVNGIVMPYVNVPQQQCRLRFINGANSRFYGLNIPFYEKCQVIASDMGYLNAPYRLTAADELTLFNLERVELMCDFREVAVGSVFHVTDVAYASGDTQLYDGIFQLRVAHPPNNIEDGNFEVPSELNAVKNLKDLFIASVGGKTRNITLEEVVDANDCPTQLLILEDNRTTSYLEHQHIECVKGTVEKWNFYNPTADIHPFHWHAISVQCGPADDTINVNALKDTVPIPNAEDQYDTVTQVCYVACTPNSFLEEGSSTPPDAFSFSTALPYVFHCHILEHEENAMMTYFLLVDGDADAEDRSSQMN